MMSGGEDYEWLGPPFKLLRIAYLLFVLIVGATYTANLAVRFAAQTSPMAVAGALVRLPRLAIQSVLHGPP
jgi:hypothetical protein